MFSTITKISHSQHYPNDLQERLLETATAVFLQTTCHTWCPPNEQCQSTDSR